MSNRRRRKQAKAVDDMRDGAPPQLLCCKRCRVAVSASLVTRDAAGLVERDAADRIPPGAMAIESDAFFPQHAGWFVVNLADLRQTDHTTNPARLNGCCGLDGLDGHNLLCANGHEIGVEKSDCWMPHCALLDPSLVFAERDVSQRTR